MEWTEVKGYLEENKESDANVKQYLEGFNPLRGVHEGNVHELVESNASLKSYRDKGIEKSLQTWRENTLPGIIEEKVAEERTKLKPKSETPELKRIRELEEKLDASDKEKLFTARRDMLRAEAGEVKFDPELAVDFAVFGDDAAKSIMRKHADAWAKKETALRNELLVKGGTPPGSGDPPEPPKEFKNMQAGGSNEFDEFLKTPAAQIPMSTGVNDG